MYDTQSQRIADLIRAKYSCIDYARDVLGCNISRPGARCTSPLRADSSNPTSFVVFEHSWCDYGGTGRHGGYLGGDVIDLCAWAHHNGDRAKAFVELGEEFFTGKSESDYRVYVQKFSDKIDAWHRDLLAPHNQAILQKHLLDRNISMDTIKRLKIGYSSFLRRVIVPYWRNGTPVYWVGRDIDDRYKLPKKDPNFSPKYLKKKCDSSYLENIPWGMQSLAPITGHEVMARSHLGEIDKDKWLIIGEGVYDILSFEQEGWHVMGSCGGHFSREWIPFIISTCRHFENILLCFDNDIAGKSFTRAMALHLMHAGISFRAGNVPLSFNGKNTKDISDFYCAGGNLADLVADSSDGVVTLAESFTEKDIEGLKTFLKEAGKYLDTPSLVIFKETLLKLGKFSKKYIDACISDASKAPTEKEVALAVADDKTLLYRHSEGFFEYKGTVWESVPEETVMHYADPFLGKYSTFGRMKSAMRHLTTLPEIFSEDSFNTQNIFAFPNCVHDLETGKVMPHSKEYLTTIMMRYFYDAKAHCPKFLKFVHEIMDNDPAKVNLIQEMGGYPFFVNNPLQVAFFLIGDGANGKSVLLEIMKAVYGKDNYSCVPLSSFGDQFAPMGLKNSIANFCTETRVDLKDSEQAIKQVIACEDITAAHKGVDAETFTPRAKIFCACNNFVASKDLTYAFVRRMVLINFPKTFTGVNANPNLIQELMKELPGIYNWFYEGYKRVKANNRLTETSEQKALHHIYLMTMNPMAEFINDLGYLSEYHNRTFTAESLFSLYREWCKNGNYKETNRRNFTASMKRLIRQLTLEGIECPVVFNEPDPRHTEFSVNGYKIDYDAIIDQDEIAQELEKVKDYPALQLPPQGMKEAPIPKNCGTGKSYIGSLEHPDSVKIDKIILPRSLDNATPEEKRKAREEIYEQRRRKECLFRNVPWYSDDIDALWPTLPSIKAVKAKIIADYHERKEAEKKREQAKELWDREQKFADRMAAIRGEMVTRKPQSQNDDEDELDERYANDNRTTDELRSDLVEVDGEFFTRSVVEYLQSNGLNIILPRNQYLQKLHEENAKYLEFLDWCDIVDGKPSNNQEQEQENNTQEHDEHDEHENDKDTQS